MTNKSKRCLDFWYYRKYFIPSFLNYIHILYFMWQVISLYCCYYYDNNDDEITTTTTINRLSMNTITRQYSPRKHKNSGRPVLPVQPYETVMTSHWVISITVFVPWMAMKAITFITGISIALFAMFLV